MPIPLVCDCGRSFRAKEEWAGRKVRCLGCGAVLVVPQPRPEGDIEDEALNLLLADSEPEPPPPRPEPAAAPRGEAVRRPAPAPVLPKAPPPGKPRKSRAVSRDEEPDRAGFSIAIHREIIAGVLMMAGAALWFGLGWAAGIIYFYPPILFVLGIGAVIRGFTGRE